MPKKKRTKKRRSRKKISQTKLSTSTSPMSLTLTELLNPENEYLISDENLKKIKAHDLCKNPADIILILTYAYEILNISPTDTQKSFENKIKKTNKLFSICLSKTALFKQLTQIQSKRLFQFIGGFDHLFSTNPELSISITNWTPLKAAIETISRSRKDDLTDKKFQHTTEIQSIVWRPYCQIETATVVYATYHDTLLLGCEINKESYALTDSYSLNHLITELRYFLADNSSTFLNTHILDPQDITRLKSIAEQLPPGIVDLLTEPDANFDHVLYCCFPLSVHPPLPNITKKTVEIFNVSKNIKSTEIFLPRFLTEDQPRIATPEERQLFATESLIQLTATLNQFNEEHTQRLTFVDPMTEADLAAVTQCTTETIDLAISASACRTEPEITVKPISPTSSIATRFLFSPAYVRKDIQATQPLLAEQCSETTNPESPTHLPKP